MKIELTKDQAERIMKVLYDKFQETKDVTFLGLHDNIDMQVNYKEKKRHYVESWLKDNFKEETGVIDPFGRVYSARPVFQYRDKIKKDIHTEEHNIGGINIRLHQYSPMHQTKSYCVTYTIL